VRSATTAFPGLPSSVPAARRWAVATLEEWGLSDTCWSAAQVVSELATNCTLHARSDFRIRLALEGTAVLVEAEDAVAVPLQARASSATATTGRGLAIVGVLAAEWGVTTSAAGKTVWARLPVDATDIVPSEDDVSGHAVGCDRVAASGGGALTSSGRGAAA
jgi:anti-sigma regulatory factor (Ser/Thr protein kinase)